MSSYELDKGGTPANRGTKKFDSPWKMAATKHRESKDAPSSVSQSIADETPKTENDNMFDSSNKFSSSYMFDRENPTESTPYKMAAMAAGTFDGKNTFNNTFDDRDSQSDASANHILKDHMDAYY
eukprot:CAMPEP_0170500010 /NCGR_PEP_ID=MMETSP0208-20121228/33414_1 /TAXON_ID=197538 /ORGANISM="Strombidium inclinatum, Strain S3" /LENGTH=124 /DNA_ID=CAMNT_0010777839 /DNA_START=1578 /DNA_END=1952 /DNA_ORIENTATION=-